MLEGLRPGGSALGSSGVFFGVLIAAVLIAPSGILLSDGAVFCASLLPSALVLGLLTCALPFSFEMKALMRLPARVYGTLTSLEPAIGALMGLLFLDE